MNGPDDHSTEDGFEALLDGLLPGDPLAEVLQDELHPRGPVSVDPDTLDASVVSLEARFAERRVRDAEPPFPPPTETRVKKVGGGSVWKTMAGLLAAAAVLVAVASVAWQAGLRAAPTEEPPPPAPLAHGPELTPDPAYGEVKVQVAGGSEARVSRDSLELVDGVVSVARTHPRQVGPHSVSLPSLDLLVEPIGTEYSVGLRDGVAAIWVRRGRVRLMHGTEGHLGEIDAGSWALVVEEGPDIELHRLHDGPFHPTELGLDPSAAELLADMRWLALPEGAREAILPPGDAP